MIILVKIVLGHKLKSRQAISLASNSRNLSFFDSGKDLLNIGSLKLNFGLESFRWPKTGRWSETSEIKIPALEKRSKSFDKMWSIHEELT